MSRRGVNTLIGLVGVSAFILRIWGIQNHFWMLEDQMRDWSVALGSFWSLPLVGPPTHVHGYTIGPAFYWILWLIRVVLGPFFENLPHAGGIGQAALQTCADVLLLVAIWRRTGSPWIAFATFLIVVTSAYDLALSSLVWNPTMGSTLAKAATALVLLNWHSSSWLRLGIVAAIAWASVHAYTGAGFVAGPVLVALAVDVWMHRGRAAALTAVGVIAAAVFALQVPYLIHQFNERFADPAMGVVTGGIVDILAGRAAPEWTKSIDGYREAVQYIVFMPWHLPSLGLWLIGASGITAWVFRRDPPLVILLVLPQLAAIVGCAIFLGALDFYYYLSVIPAAVMTLLLPLTRFPRPLVRRAVGIAVLGVAAAMVPQRAASAATQLRMPEYRLLVATSRTIRNLHKPFRAIVLEFPLPPTADPDYLYRVLGGEMDRSSPWVAVIAKDGTIRYINNDLNRAKDGGK